MKTMNDVNEMRLTAAQTCGILSRLMGDLSACGQAQLSDVVGMGVYLQWVANVEAYVKTRERITAMRQYHMDNPIVLAVIADVIDIMDELEGE